MKKKAVRIAAATLCMSMVMSQGALAAGTNTYSWNYSGWNFTNMKNWSSPVYKNLFTQKPVQKPEPDTEVIPENVLEVPELQTCKFIHQTLPVRDCLRIDWVTVEEAESYELEVSDGEESRVYKAKGDGFSVPVGYDDFVTGCMRGCTVKIRAVAPDGTYSDWSPARKIGCNAIGR